MSFHDVQVQMRQYLRRVYGPGTQMSGPPIPMGGGVWYVWVKEPGAHRSRKIEVKDRDLRKLTSNDPSRKKRGKHASARLLRNRRRRAQVHPADQAHKIQMQELRYRVRKASRDGGRYEYTVYFDNRPFRTFEDKAAALRTAAHFRKKRTGVDVSVRRHKVTGTHRRILRKYAGSKTIVKRKGRHPADRRTYSLGTKGYSDVYRDPGHSAETQKQYLLGRFWAKEHLGKGQGSGARSSDRQKLAYSDLRYHLRILRARYGMSYANAFQRGVEDQVHGAWSLPLRDAKGKKRSKHGKARVRRTLTRKRHSRDPEAGHGEHEEGFHLVHADRYGSSHPFEVWHGHMLVGSWRTRKDAASAMIRMRYVCESKRRKARKRNP